MPISKGQSVLVMIHSRLRNQIVIRKPSRRSRWRIQTNFPHKSPPGAQIAQL
ncbi:hypothetical protein QL093DRAFT_2343748 [Fusarium oxysporum]|nr:hypothetical protein QL093DRAFT_2343748 [Fusarium oxysporum]